MNRARYTQVSLDSTSYYHCICRCVRRAFLCGKDHYSGQNYEYRCQWVVDRLTVMAEVFASNQRHAPIGECCCFMILPVK